MPTDSMLTVFPTLQKKAENLHNCHKLSKVWRNYKFLFLRFLILKYFILVKTNYFIYITDIILKSGLNMCSGLNFPLPLGGWNVTVLFEHQHFSTTIHTNLYALGDCYAHYSKGLHISSLITKLTSNS
jgi:hypothetical protein